ncbi:MAG: peptidyl-prolyl cis-trans isomerase [Verrucomicrobia bacterium]|nr:peptidyl-prolyl cis-trans isomerase [Verrucomicrobiota bacterium]
MISWIQRYFQQHFRIVFALILGSTIISFIIAFAPGSNFGKTDRRNAVTRPFFGYNLASQEDQGRIIGDANLSANLQSGYNALEGADLQNYAFQRVAALALADELHVPATSKQEIADFIKNLRAFAGQDGQFDAVRYGQFRDSLKSSNSRVTEADVSRVIADDVRADKVQRILSGPGYVLANDVKTQLDRADSLWTLATATADFATFKPSIPVTDAALAKYYEENSFRYTIAPRVVVSAAFFPAAAYTAGVNVGESEVRAYYDANPARFPNPAAKPGAKADAAADYAAVRPQVEAALKLERAQRLAVKAASDLSFALYDGKIEPGSAAFDSLLASQKIHLQPLAPFTREEGPAEFGHSADIAAEAFKLESGRTYSDALAAPGGAVVLFWKETLPSRQPALAEVRDRVAADYTANEKSKRFVEFGRTLRSLIENRLKAGDTFEKAVASAASATSVKIECKTLAPFSRRNPPKDLDYSVAGAMDRLEKGQLSDMVIAKDHGLFVYAIDKKLPDLSESGPAFAAMRAQIAAVNGRIGASARLSALVEQELKRSEPVVK